MKPETRFWQRVKTGLVGALPAPAHVQRLEPGGAAPGCPDVNICVAGEELWIELKVVAGGRKVRTLSATQAAWLCRRARCGGKAWILALHAPTGDLILWPGEQAQALLQGGLDVSPSLRLPWPWDWSSVAGTLLRPRTATPRERMSPVSGVRTPVLTEMSPT